MQIKLINVATKGIDLTTGEGVDNLCARLQATVSLQSWDYNFAEDIITIEVPDGTVIPDLSEFGEVQNDSSIG
jgi:hypothetical protein